MEHECKQKEIIAEFHKRFGSGDVTLATLKLQLDQILEQTKKTNGRVTTLETRHAETDRRLLMMSYTWKHVVKDIALGVSAIGGVLVVLQRVLGG